jgi:hypothetical protein
MCLVALSMRRTRALIGVGILASAALVAACSPATDGSSPEPRSATTSVASGTSSSLTPGTGAPQPPGATENAWRGSSLPAHSRLSASKDSIVYVGLDDKQPLVVALDAATGKERWRQATEMGGRIRGVELQLYVDDAAAYFLVRSEGATTVAYDGTGADTSELALVAVETVSGHERWRTPLTGLPDPSVHACGEGVCLVVHVTRRTQLWQFDRTTGEILNRGNASAKDGRGDDAIVTGDHTAEGESDISRFITASRGPVFISQFSDAGAQTDWSEPVSDLFGDLAVSPNGGWAGWPVDGGWIIHLGPAADPPAKPKVGETFSPGALAGFDDAGGHRWVHADRGPCFLFLASTPSECDGDVEVTSDTTASVRPQRAIGLDPLTGEATWTLELDGTIDEFDASKQVLQIDDNVFLVMAPAGPTLLDVRQGPAPATDARAVGWCTPGQNARDEIDTGNTVTPYKRASSPFPCRLGGERVTDPPLPVPEFAGVVSGDWSAWMEEGVVLAKRAR